MRTVYEARIAEASKIEGQICAGGDEIVPRNFGKVARVLWPFKTAAHIAAIADVDERTAKRWLSGEFDPPICIVLATIDKTFGKHPRF